MEKVNDRVEAVNDRVNPSRIVRRRTARLRGGVRNVRESVMGTVEEVEPSRATESVRSGAQQASRRVSRAAGSLADDARAAPDVVRGKTQGNPLLAGLVAFGGGLVLASALRPSEKEREAAQRIVEGLEPLKEQAVSAGRSVAGELQQSAQVRAERLKEQASSRARRVKSEAQGSAEEVRDRAGGATKRVQKRAQASTKRVQKRAQASTKRVQKQAQKQARRPAGAAKSQAGPGSRRTAKRTARSS